MTDVYSSESEVGEFNKISIPLVRKIYAPLIVDKLVSVQPLLGPTGLVYYLRHRYSLTKEEREEIEVARKDWKVVNPVVVDPDVAFIETFLAS